MKPQKRCNKSSCRKLIDYDHTYCDEHKSKKNFQKSEYYERKQKDGKYFLFYKSTSWTKLSKLYRYTNPCCEICLKEGKIVKVDVVDHIIEIRDDWELRLDESNLMSLCHEHHNRKTRQAQRDRKEPRNS